MIKQVHRKYAADLLGYIRVLDAVYGKGYQLQRQYPDREFQVAVGDLINKVLGEKERWYNEYARLQDGRDPALDMKPAMFPMNSTIEFIYDAVGFAKVKRPLPKILALKTDKRLKVYRYPIRAQKWTAADQEKYMRLAKRLKEAGKNGNDLGEADEIRVLRRKLKSSLSYSYKLERCHLSESISVSPASEEPPMKVIGRAYKALRRKISHERAALRLRMVQTNGRVPNTRKVGKVYTQPSSVLMVIKAKKKQAVFTQKSPTSKLKHVGIELEFCSKSDNNKISDALFDAGLMPYVTLKTDGSLRRSKAGDHTHELCILAPESEYVTVVQRVCKVLRATGGYVNSTCGMHVHLDMRQRKPEVAYTRLLNSLNILYAMTPPSRRNNRFCARNHSDMTWNPNTDNRYWAINPASYNRHKTIEVRLHSGTIDARKVNYWIELLLAIIAANVDVAYKSPQRFIVGLNLNDSLAGYIMERVTLFEQETVNDDEEHVRELYDPDRQSTPQCACGECLSARSTPSADDDYAVFEDAS